MSERLTSKLVAIITENGGPKIIQHINAVETSTDDNIKSLYFLDKLLSTVKLKYIR